MVRIKVKTPEKFSFSTILTIRITDINYGGHVGNDSYLSMAQEARQQFFLQAGYTEIDMEGAGVIMVDAALEYKRELKYGDEIRIWVSAGGFDKLGFDLYYLMEVKKDSEWLLATKIKTGMLFFDYKNKTKIAMPDLVVKKLLAIS